MYKSNSIWDEEEKRQEKYNATPGKDKNSPDYHGQKDYASGESQSDVYNSNKAKEENKKKEATGIEKEVKKEEKKYEKRENASEEDIKKKAASEVHDSTKNQGDDSKKKKEHKTIEDAINKAMKEEKELIYVDD